ncbi:MAG: hypothetical protein HY868_22840 [Chloroflexi bacterium]|nr:hypothetical protein [Chloroflexota bacterium]
MAENIFPFSLNELRSHLTTIYPDSFVVQSDAAFWLHQARMGRQVAVLTRPDNPVLDAFHGERHAFRSGYVLKLCPTDHANAHALRETLPWLKPTLLGLVTSAGMGDRLGLATPGHVRAVRATGDKIAPIFSQQSIREMERTGRSPNDVMSDATWGAFQAGWNGKLGADADHLKTPENIDICVAAGFSFFTIDPGAHVDSAADKDSAATIQEKVAALPWIELESTAADLEKHYVGQTIELENRALKLEKGAILRAAAKYGHAIAHVVKMYRYLVAQEVAFELEVSVDETDTPTTHTEHIFFASELNRLGVEWVSLAPRYIGRFEKGSDYIGDLKEFEKDFAVHAEIARALGPYKLSLHSGSDKFSVYGIAAQHTRGMVHLKTAGTSYLEALRTIAALDTAFFRSIYVFGRERYENDRVSYHVSAQLSRAPLPGDVSDAELASLLDQFDAREIFHVTFGSVLRTRDAQGKLMFYDKLMALLRANPNAYAANLEKHFVRHLKPFVQ